MQSIKAQLGGWAYTQRFFCAELYLLCLRRQLASCLIYAWTLPAHPTNNAYNCRSRVCSFIEPDLFDNNVPFDNTTPIYLINLL